MNQLQERILDIFKTVAQICDDHQIPYYAIGGTMIGAARHQGFIPWDDDLDIAVPIEHFDRLMEELEKNLPEHLKLYRSADKEYCGLIFIKVIDERTTFIEKECLEYPDMYRGVFVDIMPISGVPANRLAQKIFVTRVLLLAKLNYYRRLPPKEMAKKITKAMSYILHLFAGVIPYNAFSDRWMKLLQKYPLYQAEKTGYVWSQKLKKLVFDAEDFHGTVLLDFEDTKISCPKGWENYLTVQFGDYMALPPVEEQVGKHDGIVDLGKSYHYYLKHGIGDFEK